MRAFLIVFIIFYTMDGYAQPLVEHPVVADLRQHWKVFSDNAYESYVPKAHTYVKTIYFEVDPGRYSSGSQLRLESRRPISVYLNYQQIFPGDNLIVINIDSLRAHVHEPWLISVYNHKGLSWLQTEVISPPQMRADLNNTFRTSDYYLDFSIIIGVLLTAFFVVLLRTNPRLTLDYLNFVRLFSMQEREDTLLNSRISASVNILYYVLGCLVAGFVLLTIFHFGDGLIPVAESFTTNSLGRTFLQWFKLSGIILVILFIKLILVLGLARLFAFREAPTPQFFNYVRLIFFISITSGMACLCYFVFKIQSPEAYVFLLSAIVLLLFFWIAIVGLKLLRRSTFRFFHLFSYLCASELIPIVILVKVLNS